MKRISKEEMKSARVLLSKLPYKPLAFGNSILVFPINDEDETKDVDGIELTLKKSTDKIRSQPTPVILMNSSSSDPVVLAYADLSYARDFDMLQYCELLNIQLSKTERAQLSEFEAKLINKDNILASYRF